MPAMDIDPVVNTRDEQTVRHSDDSDELVPLDVRRWRRGGAVAPVRVASTYIINLELVHCKAR